MFTYVKKAHYHETDQMGVIHHSNYVKWMEEARIAYLEQLGFGYEQVEQEQVFSPVVSLSVHYQNPVYFADEVEIGVTVKKYTAVKLELSYRFFNRTKQQACACGESVHCLLKAGKLFP